jgi:preprotein translocase subunit SecB
MSLVKPAPVQLVGYTVESVHFDVNPSHLQQDAGAIDGSEVGEERFDFAPEVISIPDSDNEGLLRLEIGINRDHEEWNSYYQFSLRVVGRFRWVDSNPSVSEETFKKYYIQSGLSILYGVLRDRVVSLCSASPYPRMMLPTITFEQIIDKVLEDFEEDSEDE